MIEAFQENTTFWTLDGAEEIHISGKLLTVIERFQAKLIDLNVVIDRSG